VAPSSQPNLARRLLRHFRVEPDNIPAAPPPPPQAAPEPPIKPLSDREKEILQLIGKGVSNNEAAQMLNLSKATIRTHLEHIYRKLEVTNRVEAVTEGIRRRIIST
jgi:DNA-binding NarL/FixJ family response regulator